MIRKNYEKLSKIMFFYFKLPDWANVNFNKENIFYPIAYIYLHFALNLQSKLS